MARTQGGVPEMVLTGAALWDVLHVRSVQQYSDAMHAARKTLHTLLVQVRCGDLFCA